MLDSPGSQNGMGFDASPRRTILLVDDHPGIVEVAAEMVAQWGFDSVEARNGDEAIEFLEKLGSEISLLLTDIVMPGALNGLDVAEFARRKFRLPSILITGNPDHSLCRKAKGRFEILVKPFSVDELGRRIGAALGVA